MLQRCGRGRCRRRRRGQDAAGAVADHASGPGGFGASEVQKMAEVVLELLQMKI